MSFRGASHNSFTAFLDSTQCGIFLRVAGQIHEGHIMGRNTEDHANELPFQF